MYVTLKKKRLYCNLTQYLISKEQNLLCVEGDIEPLKQSSDMYFIYNISCADEDFLKSY